MKYIELTQGKQAIVDDEDFERLNQWKWFANKNKHTWYARRNFRKRNGKYSTIGMHQQILDAGKSDLIDHRDGDGLNNTRGNIRICTYSQNSMNCRLAASNKSGFIGVSYCHRDKRWMVYARDNKGKQKYLGRTICTYKGAGLYDRYIAEHRGTFARTNGVEPKCLHTMLCAMEGGE